MLNRRPTINLKDKAFLSDAAYNYENNEIKLNIEELRDYSKKHDIEFYEYVARCLNHEFLHYIFYIEHGEDTAHALDGLCNAKHELWMEHWLW